MCIKRLFNNRSNAEYEITVLKLYQGNVQFLKKRAYSTKTRSPFVLFTQLINVSK
jgi:hypothetical protein